MTFKAEFEISGPYTKSGLESHKGYAYCELGALIGNSFGWHERRPTIVTNPEAERYKLEIEAFPMDKWIEFKQKLYELFHKNELILSGGVLEHMLKELESYGSK